MRTSQGSAGVLELTEEERDQLQRWARRGKSSRALALRSRIVLTASGADNNKAVAADLGCVQATVGKWRAPFVAHRPDGLTDEDRPGRLASITAEQVEEVVVATLDTGDWSRSFLRRLGGRPTPTSRQVSADRPPDRHTNLHETRNNLVWNGEVHPRPAAPAPTPHSQIVQRGRRRLTVRGLPRHRAAGVAPTG